MMKKFNIFVIGCQMNKSDSERIATYLMNLGLEKVDKPQLADVVVLVTCGVRQSAEDRIFGLIPSWQAKNKQIKIVMTGCLALRPDVREKLKNRVDVWLPINDLPALGKALGLSSEAVDGTYNSLTYLSYEADYESTFSAFVPIGNGCNNFCSYCVVPYARGREVYRPHEEIVEEIKKLIRRGYKEITLIAQNVNSYCSVGTDGQRVDFADLMKMIDEIPGDWWLRFATSHPKDMSEKLIVTVASGQHTCQYFHFAAQSGDDEILRLMNRRYTREHYLQLVRKIRDYSPEAMISTDIIVGFPSETEEQFNNTQLLMKEAKFDMAYIAQYSPRPGTVSAKMIDNVSKEDKKRREEIINDILKETSFNNNQKCLGRTVRVLVDCLGMDKDGQKRASGKTADFKTVSFKPTAETKIGEFSEVKISEVKAFGLYE